MVCTHKLGLALRSASDVAGESGLDKLEETMANFNEKLRRAFKIIPVTCTCLQVHQMPTTPSSFLLPRCFQIKKNHFSGHVL